MNFWFQKTPNDRAARGVNYENHGGAPTGRGHGAGAGKCSLIQQPEPVEHNQGAHLPPKAV